MVQRLYSSLLSSPSKAINALGYSVTLAKLRTDKNRDVLFTDLNQGNEVDVPGFSILAGIRFRRCVGVFDCEEILDGLGQNANYSQK
jgi:hypothetical protein